MSVRSEKSTGFLQPYARIAVTVPGVVCGVSAVLADVADRGLQGIDEFGERSAGSRFGPIPMQPAAGAAEVASCAYSVVRIEVALQVAVGEIDLAFDKPAGIGEQGRSVPRYGSCLVDRRCCHEYPEMRRSSA